MTRKTALTIERRLKAHGVYRPYVASDSDGRLFAESYPLTVMVVNSGCDPDAGPFHTLKLTDCSLPRIGQDPVITTRRVFFGQPMEQHIAQLLTDFHGPAYERASAQDKEVSR